jgi:hypothetical protein
MKSFWVLVLGILAMCAVAVRAKTDPGHPLLTAELESKLDARHARVGDKVVLRSSSIWKAADGSRIPSGAKLIGHVIGVKIHDRSDFDSRIEILFDRAEWQKHRNVPIHAQIEAIDPTRERPRSFFLEAPVVGSWGDTPQGGDGATGPR